MKKQKNKITLLFIFIIGLLYITTYIMSISLEPGDPIWNFGIIYKLYNGNKMYTDIGTVQTNLFFELGKILFKILGANFFVYQIYNCIVALGIVFASYKILDLLKVRTILKILTIIILLEIPIFCWTNYSILAFLLMEIGIIIDLKITKNKYKNIIHGIICAISFFIYQKNGIGYLLSVIVIRIINDKLNKETILNIIHIVAIFLVGLLIGICYFYINNNLNDFINICILGIIDFQKNNTIIFTFDLIYLIIYIPLIIFSMVMYKKSIDKNVKKNIVTIFTFAIGEFIVIYPIFNSWHIYLALILFIILTIYNINISFGNMFETKLIKKIIYILLSILVLYRVYAFSYLLYKHIEWNIEQKLNYKNPYFGIYIDEEMLKHKKIICDYIKSSNKEVIVLSDYALLYGIELNMYNGYFDIPLNGNIGLNGENKMIEKIKQMENVTILVPDKEKSKYENYQYVNKVRDFIKNNYNKIGEIENYDIYQITKSVV